MNEYAARFELLRSKAESVTRTGGASPDQVASALFTHTARPSCPEKSLALACSKGNLGTHAVASNMRRLFGSRGGAAPRDVLAATDVDADSNDEDDFAARSADGREDGGRTTA